MPVVLANSAWTPLAVFSCPVVLEAKETLIRCCLSTASIDKVIWHELFQSAEDTGDDDGIRAVHKEDAAGDVSGRDGAGGAMGQVVRVDRAALSEAGQRKTAERVGTDAADLFSAAVVQPVGPGGGRGFVRLGHVAAVCGD